MTFANIPDEMQKYPNWILWKLEDRGGKKANKTPYSIDGKYARVNDPSTWSSFEEALRAYEGSAYSGVGFVLTNTPFIGIDVDGCFDLKTGAITEVAADLLTMAATYAEISQSGTGFHAFLKGKLPDGRNRNGSFEMYGEGSARYFVMTGNQWGDSREIREDQGTVDAIHKKFFEPKGEPPKAVAPKPTEAPSLSEVQIIERARAAKNGAIFPSLWDGDTSAYDGDDSRADLALCNILAFWCQKDASQMDRLFRQSGLYRPKWDEKRGRDTYGNITIGEAIDTCTTTYDPQGHFEKRVAAFSINIGQSKQTLPDLHPERNERFGWHDMGNGNLFSDWYQDKARYVPERKKWFIYDGKVWRPDTGDLKVMQLCKTLADKLTIYALSLKDEMLRQEYLKHTAKWQKRSYRETIIKDAAGVYPIGIEEFDANPFLFNCLNGTFDLKTGLFRGHRAADMISKSSGVNFDHQAKCERWKRFIDEVMQGDQDKAVFLQKALGYALTGDTKHECFFILYGATSRNGKGTAMETFARMMGDYGKSAKPDSIAQKQTANGAGPSEDIARLAGARFVNISEPDKKLVLSSALVKTLTGNDTISARFLNENSFEYRPQFKLFINTNHLPSVTDVTLFTSGRVKIIPFERHFEESARDPGLKAELMRPENLSAILNWCFTGLRLIEETGFETPEAVRAATDDYRSSSDKIGRFIDEVMDAAPTSECRTSDAYPCYKMWCTINGFFPENAANFKSSLSNVATVVKRRPAGSSRTASPVSLLLGYSLKPEFAKLNDMPNWGQKRCV